MTDHANARPSDLRFARLASVLAAGVRDGQLEQSDALRVLKHQLRLFNRNKAIRVARRSVGAQDVIDRYERDEIAIPKNGSWDALHADHVFPLKGDQLSDLVTASDWLGRLDRLREVVCVTAAENETLRQVEAANIDGWEKYIRANIELLESDGETWVPLDLVAAGLVADDLSD
jgi:hypothetical protein